MRLELRFERLLRMVRRSTEKLVAVRCKCGKAAITATVKELSAGLFHASVEDQVTQCPVCGSKDMKAAHAAQEALTPDSK